MLSFEVIFLYNNRIYKTWPILIKMELEKKLIIDHFIFSRVKNALFTIKAVEGIYESELNFDNETLAEYDIDPHKDLVNTEIIITLKSRELKDQENSLIGLLKKDDVLIRGIERKQVVSWLYGVIPPEKLEKEFYSAHFQSYCGGGSVSIMPCPFYKLNLGLDRDEYLSLKSLSKKTVMKVSFRLNK